MTLDIYELHPLLIEAIQKNLESKDSELYLFPGIVKGTSSSKNRMTRSFKHSKK